MQQTTLQLISIQNKDKKFMSLPQIGGGDKKERVWYMHENNK